MELQGARGGGEIRYARLLSAGPGFGIVFSQVTAKSYAITSHVAAWLASRSTAKPISGGERFHLEPRVSR